MKSIAVAIDTTVKSQSAQASDYEQRVGTIPQFSSEGTLERPSEHSPQEAHNTQFQALLKAL